MHLDAARLEALVVELGATGAEDVMCRAMEELATRLARAERCWREENWMQMRKSARGLIAIADQLGMCLVAHVARDVVTSIDERDPTALAATLSRLLRIGERSLSEIWEMQDLSI